MLCFICIIECKVVLTAPWCLLPCPSLRLPGHGVNDGVRKRIRTYIDHVYLHKTAFNEQSLLEELPENMRQSVIQYMYKDFLVKMPFFRAIMTPPAYSYLHYA